ncbi:MAG TPA: site-specific recombinase [Ideonella sp.]|nr:site-specific recombinase [Ideonella sp.]
MAHRWDLTALLNAADPNASLAERHLWLIRLVEWLREPGPQTAALSAPQASADGGLPVADPASLPAEPLPSAEPAATPWPVRRLRHLLNVLDRHPAHRARFSGLLLETLHALDATGLLADYGFAPRQGFLSELADRVRLACLPGTPQTTDLGELFHLLFIDADDAAWISAIDETTLNRAIALCSPPPEHGAEPAEAPSAIPPWEAAMVESIQLLASQMRAAGLSQPMRQRMDRSLLADRPFHQVVQAAEALRSGHLDGSKDRALLRREAQYLGAVLDACRRAADSVRGHLDEHGISVDVVFQVDQLRARAERIDALLACLVSREPAVELRRLMAGLVSAGAERLGLRSLFAQHYALLARKVTERSAETGEHYITRDRAGYKAMLGKAAGGGALIGVTTLLKFALAALTLSVFWAGFWAGINYATCFVLVHLLHWTVATKQPAMTAPTLAAKLENTSVDEHAMEGFVDEVAHLLRSQFAGIVGNLTLVVPVVLGAQALSWWALGQPLISQSVAHHVLETQTLLGPTAAFAAFTGVLLFASSLIAGWVENWFVFHRLDSAIAWNPRFIAGLGASRALRWSRWWRVNISGLAANVSLGLMLGLVPAVGLFFGLPLEVRHVTLSTGQLAAALGTLGTGLLDEPAFWWCLASIPVIGALNLAVSFTLAFRVAMASRGLKLRDRGRIYRAVRSRLWRAPLSFFWPPRTAARGAATEEH